MEPRLLALACGHTANWARTLFRWNGTSTQSTVLCPEGCGWQEWVAEPADLDETEAA